MALTTVLTAGAVLVSAWQIHSPTVFEWLTIPAAFLVANLVEYLGHRYPMHHALPGLRAMCLRHAGQHHRFYTHNFMTADKACDWQIILFPPVLLAFFLGAIATPLAALLFVMASANVAWFFVGTAAAYCLIYEWMHLAYHQAPTSFLGQRRIVQRLRWLHLVHHDPGKMTKGNFNITFPIFDILLGTRLGKAGYKDPGQPDLVNG